MVDDTFLHVDDNGTGFEVLEGGTDGEVGGFGIGVAEEGGEGVVVEVGFVVALVLVEQEVPETVAHLVAALAHLDCDDLAHEVGGERRGEKFELL